MTAVEADDWGSVDLLALSGATYRQLDHWCRTGRLGDTLTRRHGHGVPRRFTTRDVQICCYVVRLLPAFVLDKAFEIATALADNGHYTHADALYRCEITAPKETAA